jgi:hypothetical protein
MGGIWYGARWCDVCQRYIKRPLTGEKGNHVHLWNEDRCYYCGNYFHAESRNDSSEKCPVTGGPHEWQQKMQVAFNNQGDFVGSEPSGRYFCIHCLKEIKDPHL